MCTHEENTVGLLDYKWVGGTLNVIVCSLSSFILSGSLEWEVASIKHHYRSYVMPQQHVNPLHAVFDEWPACTDLICK